MSKHNLKLVHFPQKFINNSYFPFTNWYKWVNKPGYIFGVCLDVVPGYFQGIFADDS